MYAKITGIGSYLPEKIIDNDYWSKIVDTNNDWIVSRTGIETRHQSLEHEDTTALAYNAAKNAIADAKIDPELIELIIVATCTPDNFFPSTASALQHKLGIKSTSVIAMDVSAACTGFVYAVDMATQYITNKRVKHALVIGAERLLKAVNTADRSTCVLFGDGAGAAVVSSSESPGILYTDINTRGELQDILLYPSSLSNAESYISMNGREVYKTAINIIQDSLLNAMQNTKYSLADLDWIIPHQANIRIIETVAKQLNVPLHKFITTINKHGNTSAASIPLALDAAKKDGKILPGNLIALVGFGAGMTWGTTVIKL